MKTRAFLNLLTIAAGIALFMSFTASSIDGGGPWAVPDKYKKMPNPVTASKASISTGSALYTTHCKSCHGKEGLGDGPKAAQLDTPCGDFTTTAFQGQSDGSIFYKIKIGRDDMPSFEKKIPDEEDIWHIVNYLRTLE